MNEYQIQYNALMHYRQIEQPIDDMIIKHVHRHHIKPKSLFKSLEHDPLNIVKLYELEHVEAHRLLTLWYKDEYGILSDKFQKMAYAYQRLAGKYDKSSLLYKEMRQLINEATSIRNSNSIWINDGTHEYFVLKDKVQNYPQCKIGRLTQPNVNKIIVTDGIHNKFVYENNIPIRFHRGFTSTSTKDRVWITNGVQQTLVSNENDIPKDWYFGMCTKNPCHDSIWINDGHVMKRIHGDIPAGWKRGKLPSKSKGQLIYVNNGIETIKVRPDAIPLGYVKGCLCCTKNRKLITNGIVRKWLKNGEPLPDGFVFGMHLKTDKNIKV